MFSPSEVKVAKFPFCREKNLKYFLKASIYNISIHKNHAPTCGPKWFHVLMPAIDQMFPDREELLFYPQYYWQYI